MGSVEDISELRVEETIYVAVGKKVEEGENLLLWAVKNFPGKTICVLYVHQPHNVERNGFRTFKELERQKMLEFLDHYIVILAKAGVKANTLWIEMDSIEQGIVEMIASHSIKWLVMGDTFGANHSRKLKDLESRIANFVCKRAPISCIIWFICKEDLVFVRGAMQSRTGTETIPPLLLLNSDVRAKQSKLSAESEINGRQLEDSVEDVDGLDGILGSFSSNCSLYPHWSFSKVDKTSNLSPLSSDEEETNNEQETKDIPGRSELAILDMKNSNHNEFGDLVKQWKVNTIEAKCKAIALESLYTKELSRRKEREELLAKEKQEVEKVKNQQDELMRQLSMVLDQNSVLESTIAESQFMITELEEKIISAVELLISFKERRDNLKMDYGNAIREVRTLRMSGEMNAKSLAVTEFPTFAFLEISEATSNFDPLWRITEGRYGSVYRGHLRHMQVAIKMFPSYGSLSQSEFQHEVEVLSRVRHPNLLTLIGSCPESRSLVYEFLMNGSLEDQLNGKDNTHCLPWQSRTSIVADICSALIFLQSHEPCLVHGNLTSSKVLLDANFVGKLGDLGVSRLVPQNENFVYADPSSTDHEKLAYLDPEYLSTGKLTPESDVYSLGVILLRLLTGRPLLGVVRDVKCALEKDNLKAVLDISAGEWPLEQAKQLACLALRCCERSRWNRPDLVSEIWTVLEQLKASCTGTAPYLSSKKLIRIPSHFVCPILQEVMKDPHIAADGFTYEAEAIRGWLESGHNTSPMTNLRLEHSNLVPNYALHNAILEWQQLHSLL